MWALGLGDLTLLTSDEKLVTVNPRTMAKVWGFIGIYRWSSASEGIVEDILEELV